MIGERFDADAGLQFLNARYYDPKLAMFIQPDWWEVMQAGVGPNRYGYSFNDPVNGMDPGGHYAASPEQEKKRREEQDKRAEAKDSTRIAQSTTRAGRGRGGRATSELEENSLFAEELLIAQIDALRALQGLPRQTRITSPDARSTPESVRALQRELSSTRFQGNIAAGRAAGQKVTQCYGNEVIGSEITIVTSTGARTRIDDLLRGMIVNETKATEFAPMSAGQTQLMRDIVSGTPVTPVGRNAVRAGLVPGQQIQLEGYQITIPRFTNLSE